jgi:hypothetical protein
MSNACTAHGRPWRSRPRGVKNRPGSASGRVGGASIRTGRRRGSNQGRAAPGRHSRVSTCACARSVRHRSRRPDCRWCGPRGRAARRTGGRPIRSAHVGRRRLCASTGRRPSADRHRTRTFKRRRAAPWGGSSCDINRRRPTLPGPCEPSTIGAEGLNFSVRNGKRCFPLAVTTGKRRETTPLRALQNCTAPPVRRCGPRVSTFRASTSARSKRNPSSPRTISTGLLRMLPPFQIRPINLVVYQGSYSLEGMGELILRPASRLDAFSGYPIRT